MGDEVPLLFWASADKLSVVRSHLVTDAGCKTNTGLSCTSTMILLLKVLPHAFETLSLYRPASDVALEAIVSAFVDCTPLLTSSLYQV